MPTYQYQCTNSNCKDLFEAFYRPSQKPETMQCPKCLSISLSIISGGQGFHLKGHGWSFDRYAGDSNFKFGKGDES